MAEVDVVSFDVGNVHYRDPRVLCERPILDDRALDAFLLGTA
ncbi:MAG TPA: hypothetical protein VJM09_14790 [Sphingobium sp.]|nr:hypothetical protein [Sphingobium sp.]